MEINPFFRISFKTNISVADHAEPFYSEILFLMENTQTCLQTNIVQAWNYQPPTIA